MEGDREGFNLVASAIALVIARIERASMETSLYRTLFDIVTKSSVGTLDDRTETRVRGGKRVLGILESKYHRRYFDSKERVGAVGGKLVSIYQQCSSKVVVWLRSSMQLSCVIAPVLE